MAGADASIGELLSGIRAQFDFDGAGLAGSTLGHAVVETVASSYTMQHLGEGRCRRIGLNGIAASFFRDAFHSGLDEKCLGSDDVIDFVGGFVGGVGNDEAAEKRARAPKIMHNRGLVAGAEADVVRDDEYGTAALRLRFVEELQCGVIDRGLDSGAASEMLVGHVEANGVCYFDEIRGEGGEDAAMSIEDHHRDAVTTAQLLQARVGRGGDFADHATHAGADIKEQNQVERLLFPEDIQDGLLPAIVENPEVLFGKAGKYTVVGTENFGVDVNEGDSAFECGVLSGAAG